ncbi:hypothetical protein Tco_1259325, partial [Tanacetum coccineum]
VIISLHENIELPKQSTPTTNSTPPLTQKTQLIMMRRKIGFDFGCACCCGGGSGGIRRRRMSSVAGERISMQQAQVCRRCQRLSVNQEPQTTSNCSNSTGARTYRSQTITHHRVHQIRALHIQPIHSEDFK